jgi:hypothetical protein
MRPVPALSFLAAVALAGCAIGINTTVGDGHVVSEQRAIGDATELDLRGPLAVEVRVGETPSLRVEADGNLLPLIRTEVVNGTLRLAVEGNVHSAHSLRVVWTAPQLSQVHAAGSGHLTVTGLKGGPLTLTKSGSGDATLSGRVGTLNMQATGSGDINARDLHSGNANLSLAGSGSIDLGDVTADALNVKVRGSGDLRAGGAVAQLNAKVTGSGEARLKALASGHAELSATGSGDITARASDSLVAQSRGSGRITVYGNPARRSITGRHVDVIDQAPAAAL